MNDMSWTTDEFLGSIAAEELGKALVRAGVNIVQTACDGDGDIHIYFASLKDAEAMMVLALREDGPGTLYDRASDNCVSLMALPEDAPPETVDKLMHDGGWTWNIHPHMRGRRMNWHLKVYMTTSDANELTALLNGVR